MALEEDDAEVGDEFGVLVGILNEDGNEVFIRGYVNVIEES